MRAFAFICCLSLFAACVSTSADTTSDADYAMGYFGELLPTLTPEQRRSAGNGFRLFVKPWREGTGFARNADSCVACHNVPMPGGSGMSDQALVGINAHEATGSREETVQRGFPSTSHIHRGEVRRTPPLFGLGYLEFADTGNLPNGGGLGAFGKVKDVRTFIARALAVELGVSSPGHCARPANANGYPDTCTAAISDAELDDMAAYLRALAPAPRRPEFGNSNGARLFDAIGCASCHIPTGVTRADAPEPLRARRFTAHTDRLVHDIGGRAPVVTSPLWGLSSVGPPYMHDACGDSITGAIACHGGEGKEAAGRFTGLSGADQQELLIYLRSL